MLDLRQKTIGLSGGRLDANWLECVEGRKGPVEEAGKRQVFDHRNMASPRVIRQTPVAEQKLLGTGLPLVHLACCIVYFCPDRSSVLVPL